ncbi:MAG: MarR family transcriptional regulator [Pseudomonadota bacterium]
MKPLELTSAQSLRLWHRVASECVIGEQHDLSQRQIAILLEIYLLPPPHTVRGMAERLQVTKPVITRALDTMGRLGLVTRRRDLSDRRNVLIQRTVAGSQYLEALGDLIAQKAREI